MFSYFTDVGKVGEATSTLEVREFGLIFTRIILTSKIQFCKVNEGLQTGGKIAQIQQKNQDVREYNQILPQNSPMNLS